MCRVGADRVTAGVVLAIAAPTDILRVKAVAFGTITVDGFAAKG